MTNNELQSLVQSAGERYFGMDDLPDYFKFVEEKDAWENEYLEFCKRVLIVKDDVNDKYYRIENYCSDCGEHMSDVSYYQATIEEVVPVPVTKIVWMKR